jgi:AcrR family transcriptional regulator
MQYLKEDIRDSIIESATDEFYQRGFENSSMRKIARRTGVTVGNLYRYFKNKESLFYHITTPVFNMLTDIIEHHDDFWDGNKGNLNMFIEYHSNKLISLFRTRRREILILIDGSRGTKFEKSRYLLVDFLCESAREHIKEYYEKRGESGDPFLAHAIVSSFIEGYWDIIRNNDDGDRIALLVKEYTRLAFSGFREIL